VTYETQPGTIVHRAIAHLKTLPEGTELSTAEFADALGIENATNLIVCMRAAVSNGAVVRTPWTTPAGRPSIKWRLGDGTPIPKEPEEDAPVQRTVPALAVTLQPGIFNASLWLDGSLILCGVKQRGDGVVILDPEQTMRLRAMVAWAPLPEGMRP
jgi:hypothetical protein